MTVLLAVVIGWVLFALGLGLLLCRAICWSRGADDGPPAAALAETSADSPAGAVVVPVPRSGPQPAERLMSEDRPSRA